MATRPDDSRRLRKDSAPTGAAPGLYVAAQTTHHRFCL